MPYNRKIVSACRFVSNSDFIVNFLRKRILTSLTSRVVCFTSIFHQFHIHQYYFSLFNAYLFIFNWIFYEYSVIFTLIKYILITNLQILPILKLHIYLAFFNKLEKKTYI